MATAATPRPMTMQEFLALPVDGIDRWLIRGQPRQKPKTMRNRFHSRTLVRIAPLLLDWADRQPAPRGEVVGGVPLVWVVDPDDHAVRIDQPGCKPPFLNEDQELIGGPHLPGFQVAVRRLFE